MVLTIIDSAADPELDAATADTVRRALSAAGADLGDVRWLHRFSACDIPFTGLDAPTGLGAARACLEGWPLDVIAQPAVGRRKKLLVADMDSTMVQGETLDELADFAGVMGQVAQITERAMNGEIRFRDALEERVGLLAGLSAEALEKTWARVQDTPGAARLVKTMNAQGARTVLVSGGFDFFTAKVAARLGFHRHLGNRLELDGDALTGRVLDPIVTKDTKKHVLEEEAARLGIPLTETLAVGDGANDLPMLLTAGLGVAFRSKPVVAASAHHRVDHGDITALLYAQGYTRAEFHE
ncbi:MAG: phosphoserine phosphatase SerB [Magnetospiraceae bacterium]